MKVKDIYFGFLVPVLVLSFGMMLMSCGSRETEDQTAAVSQEQKQNSPPAALNFTLKHINGELFNLNSLKGKVLIIDFWDTWCPPCRKGIPEFIELKNKYKDKNFEIVGIAFGRDGFEAVQRFAKDYKMNYTVLAGDRRTIQELFGVYGYIQAIPTAFIIDKYGNIVKRFVGYNPIELFEEKILMLF